MSYPVSGISGRKSAGARNKASTPTTATDPAGTMGPPLTIPKKGKGTAAVMPTSEDGGEDAQGQPAGAEMDFDAEMNEIDDGEDADAKESQEEDEGDEEEDEDEELVDQMAVEDEEVHRDTKGLDLHNQPAHGNEDI